MGGRMGWPEEVRGVHSSRLAKIKWPRAGGMMRDMNCTAQAFDRKEGRNCLRPWVDLGQKRVRAIRSDAKVGAGPDPAELSVMRWA